MTGDISWQNPRLRGRLVELDGIRGLAILLVLVWHYVASNAVKIEPGSAGAYALVPLRLTWSGVDLFFVLSGFLIGGILMDARDSTSYYRTFYLRRFWRILPLYFLWLSLFAAGQAVVGRESALWPLFHGNVPEWTYAVFLQNVWMAMRETFGAEWMGITWSLAVEEQFYLVLPLIVRMGGVRGTVAVAAAGIALAPCLRYALAAAGNGYFAPYALLPCRADALGIGVLCAVACRDQRLWTWIVSNKRLLYWSVGVLGAGMAVLLKYPGAAYTIGMTWIAGFYAVLLLLAVVNPGTMDGAFLRNPILVRLGLLAYGIYLFHQGVNALAHHLLLGQSPSVLTAGGAGVTVLAVAVVLGLATISWQVLESPLVRRASAAYRY